jgi:hypothetical protein
MEVDDKDFWKKNYKELKIVRLKHSVECSKCNKDVQAGSRAVLDQGNLLCSDCNDFSILSGDERVKTGILNPVRT